VRFDKLSRTLYSTDASIYEIIPLGVVLPRSMNDVVKTVKACRESGTAIIPRGAATGLTGGAVGSGVAIDFSLFMDRIGRVDVDARTVEVEPGVVCDELNVHLAPTGFHFAPDVATGNRATIGGMIANNACGAHSLTYGRTVDHVLSMTVVLSDGEVVRFGRDGAEDVAPAGTSPERRRSIEQVLSRIRDENFEEIDKRYPKVLRSNGGYGLDRLGPPGTPADPMKILCGSEGTLGVIVGATLNLTPLPKRKALVLLHFSDLLDSLSVVPAILKHEPAAVELVDRMILDAGRRIPAMARRCGFLQGDPGAVLIVEFFGENEEELVEQTDRLAADQDATAGSFAKVNIFDSVRQQDVWQLRKSGLGLLMSRPGDNQPYAFVEDSAVDPIHLREYIERFADVLRSEGVQQAGYYAHAGVGCLHVRPVLNLKKADDVERMRRIADAVSSMALEYGGAMTGEHGDGIIRSCWIEKMYGREIVAAMKEVKQLFDPAGLMNPGKIVDPWPMAENLRFGPSWRDKHVKTHLDFSEHNGMVGLASMCSGVGVCRQKSGGTMCPSYQATRDETHSTRARANALRIAMSNRGLLDGLDDPCLKEVLDLCLACKACKSECPTGVDVAKLKYEFLARRNLREGVPARSRLVASMPQFARTASHFPRTSNLIMQSWLVRSLMERWYGLDRRVPPPRFAARSFRSWLRNHRKQRRDAEVQRGRVIYFVDTWTNYFVPQVGMATVKLLEAAGFEVICPPTVCCGRPAISHGLLAEAKQLADVNLRILLPISRPNVPIVGTEPSCVATLVDEYPDLLRVAGADRIASQTSTIESFLLRLLEADPDALKFRKPDRELLYHAHCHQEALFGSEDAVALMKKAFGDMASEIDSGCCGMAGSFGHEVEHYDVAKAVGEDRLFPTIRNHPNAEIAISGFSCRTQIEHHTKTRPRHLVECLAEMLK
jgi:FAD/FMN-containing dehydrogenase/Fe-S oxidoreductase